MNTSSSHTAASGGGDDPELEPLAEAQLSISTQGTDELLDEIDSLLESNAEEFVRSYVQKGGQ